MIYEMMRLQTTHFLRHLKIAIKGHSCNFMFAMFTGGNFDTWAAGEILLVWKTFSPFFHLFCIASNSSCTCEQNQLIGNWHEKAHEAKNLEK